jgi:PE-PPE domain
MRVAIRSAGVVLIAIVAAVVLALTTTMTSALAATALMVGGIGASVLPDSTMSGVLNGAYTTGKDVSKTPSVWCKLCGPTWQREYVPWSGSLILGQSIPDGANTLYNEILATPGPKTVVGMSAGSLVVEEALRQLANLPASQRPDPSQLNFVFIADSSRQPFFSIPGPLTTLFGYMFQPPAQTPYNVTVVKYEYDGLSDLPDNLFNGVAVANAMAGAILLHNATFFADLSNVPAQNITTTTNSAGGVTTSYLIPAQTLPLVQLMPWLAPIEQTLKQQVDAGYNRNNPAAVTSSAAAALTTATKVQSFTLPVDPPVDAPTKPVEAPAQADQGLANATDGLAKATAEAPANATDGLAKATAEAPANATDGLAKATAEAPAQADEGLTNAHQAPANATDGLAKATAEAPAQADEGLANAHQAPANATDGLAKATAEAPAHADEGLGTATEAVSKKVTDGNKVSPSTTAETTRSSSGWKPGDGFQAVEGAIHRLFSGKTASTSTTTGAPTSDTSTTTGSETSPRQSSSSGSGSTP